VRHRRNEPIRTLGASARLWAAPDRHTVGPTWWSAFSGEQNVNYNLACCHSSSTEDLTDHCLEPVSDLGKPGIVMLSGAGLGTAQTLADAGWVTVGAPPLMAMEAQRLSSRTYPDARRLLLEEIPSARELLVDAYGLDAGSASAAVPNRAVESCDMGVWGLFVEDRLVSCVTTILEDDQVVLWSVATRAGEYGHGYARRLLDAVLLHHFDEGARGSLLHSSPAAEGLYRDIGYSVIEYLQLWARPRWAMGLG
jgi:GNAT superfamily N-acetyltransferase